MSEEINVLDRSVELLHLSSHRARRCLFKANVNTIRELIAKTPDDLLAYKNFGRVSLREIERVLADLNLKLAD